MVFFQVESLSSEKAALLLRIEVCICKPLSLLQYKKCIGIFLSIFPVKCIVHYHLQAVSRSLDNNGSSSLAYSSSSSKIDIEAGTWQESHPPRLRDRIRNGQRQLGSAIRQLDSIFSAGHIFLRRNPKALVWAMVYLVCLHIWVLYILTSHPTISEARPGATFSLESLNKTGI